LRRRWYIIVLPLLVGAVAAYAFAKLQEPQYQSSASLLFHTGDLSGPTDAVPVDSTRAAATNVDLVSSNEVAQLVAVALPPLTADSVRHRVTISSRGDSDLVSIAARDPDPVQAARIANTWAEEYIAFRRAADRAQIVKTINLINRRLARLPPADRGGSEEASLRSRRNELEITASLQTGNAEVVERARPGSQPVSPRPVRNALLGGFLGLAIGLLAALGVERLDRRIKNPGDLTARLGVPILGSVPRSRSLATEGGRPALDVTPAVREAFQILRTNMNFFNLDRKMDSVLVTSALPGEGKSTIATHLATAFAEAGARTLLLEGDLRRPSLAQRMGLPAGVGLTNVLVSEADLSEATCMVAVGSETRSGVRGQLDVLVAGPPPPNPQEMLESERMSMLVASLKQDYDVLVVDAPPMLAVADTASLTRLVSGVVIVSRLRTITEEAAAAMRARLELLGIKPLGIVVNAGDKESSTAYYATTGRSEGARASDRIAQR
jgi:receptor protein-tyrosine kinase